MTKISVNDQEIRDIEKWNLINDLVNYLLNEHIASDEVLTEITINGEEFPISNDILSERVDAFQTISFCSKLSTDLIFEAIESASHSVDTIISKILGLCDAYARNDIQKANKLFVEITEILDLFIQLIVGIQNGLKMHAPDLLASADKIKNLEIHLLTVVKSLVSAREKNDLSMICDLLEYELIDNLKEWKNSIIPQILSVDEK